VEESLVQTDSSGETHRSAQVAYYLDTSALVTHDERLAGAAELKGVVVLASA
jgi:hypothetical protein